MKEQTKIIRFVSLLLFFSTQYLLACGQEDKTFTKEVEKEIKMVENNLSGWVQIANASSSWTLSDRMKFYHCNGVSIAVIKDFKIEWAKGYGWADSAGQRRVTTTTLFQAGSNSKSLNAIGVLKLVQD